MLTEHRIGRRAAPPAAVLAHPADVVEDMTLARAEKREILAAWASDANAVPDRPWLRQLESGFQVSVREIVEALKALDETEHAPGARSIGLTRRKPSPDDEDDPPPSPVGAMPPPGGGPGGGPLQQGAAELVPV